MSKKYPETLGLNIFCQGRSGAEGPHGGGLRHVLATLAGAAGDAWDAVEWEDRQARYRAFKTGCKHTNK